MWSCGVWGLPNTYWYSYTTTRSETFSEVFFWLFSGVWSDSDLVIAPMSDDPLIVNHYYNYQHQTFLPIFPPSAMNLTLLKLHIYIAKLHYKSIQRCTLVALCTFGWINLNLNCINISLRNDEKFIQSKPFSLASVEMITATVRQ